jgi:hypothetical protein
MKTGSYALNTAKNEYTDTQNMKTGTDALGTAENESGSAKHENGTRRTRYRRNRVWARKT